MSTSMNQGRGRRVADRRRKAPGSSTWLSAAVVLAAVVAVLLTGSPQPADLAGPSPGALVDRTLLACPAAPEDAGRNVRTATFAGLAPVRGPGGPLGDAGTVRSGSGEDADALDLRRGVLRELPGRDAVVLDAEGGVAAGVFGQHVDVVARTVAAARCVAPAADWWFTGAGATLDHSSVLVIANVDPGPAVVDMRVLGADGPIETVGTRGITLGPGETRAVPLTDVAPQNDEVAVSVHATRGRVAAAVSDRFARRPSAPTGLEWLPGSDGSGRLVRLAGLPARADQRTLVVGNPGEQEALVELEVLGARGSFVPSGFETLSVAPGSTRTVDLTEMLGVREATALRVRAQVPVVATVRSVRFGDHSYAASVSALSEPAAAVLPSRRGGARAQAVVQLSAGAGGGTVTVAGYTGAGRAAGEQQLQIGASSTATWRPDRQADYVVVTPREGNVP
jgi:hypothetical protein